MKSYVVFYLGKCRVPRFKGLLELYLNVREYNGHI